MRAEIPTLFILTLLAKIAALSAAEFTYNGFNSTQLHLDGTAEVSSNGLLRIVNTTKYQQGHAFHTVPLHFKNISDGKANSFSTCFVFAIVPEYPDISGHGLALVLAPERGLPGALALQYLGLFNSTNNGNSSNHVLAVELDTIYNVEFADIDDNHIGINVNGLRSIDSASASYFVSDSGELRNISLVSGKPMQVWVEYGHPEMKLNVTICPMNIPKPSRPLLSRSIDLSSVILDTMYIGFSASTGSVSTSHYILGWSFKMNGQSPDLDLSRLPSLPPSREAGKRHTALIVGVSLAVAFFMVMTVSGLLFVVRRKIRYAEVLEEWELEHKNHRFLYKDLFKATDGFKEEELLGIGGFGRVYKGRLPKSRTEVAIKRVSHDSRQGMREFVAEIVSIGRLRHPNLVQLLGYCRRKGELLLVYEYMPNGSLDKLLFDGASPATLNWNQRIRIIKGVASGLLYLHEECKQVVHRDIKGSNVLLDGKLNGKLGDFSLSRLYDQGSDPKTARVVGTMGYIAPELTRTGKATTSTDVFAFGVFLLEVTCGRRPIVQQALSDYPNLLDWVRRCWRRGALLGVTDARLGRDFSTKEVELVLKLGLLCSHPVPAVRPSMRQVIQLLNGEISQPKISLDGMNLEASSTEQAQEFDDLSISYPSRDRTFVDAASGTEPLLH